MMDNPLLSIEFDTIRKNNFLSYFNVEGNNMEYYVYITNKCNLNCAYCSVMLEHNSQKLPDKPVYKIEDLKNFVDRMQSIHPKDPARIYFFGGEPTLDYDTIYSIILSFKNIKTYKVEYVLHTNGLLLDSIPSKLINYIDVIFLSMNYEKIFEHGGISNYFIKLLQNMSLIKTKKSIPFIGRLTVSEGTSIYSECTLIGDFFDYVYWQLDNQKALKDISAYKKQYIREITLLFDYWLSFFREGIVLRYIPFLSVIQHLIFEYPVPQNFYCGYGDDIIYIQTDGSCYACCDEVESKQHYVGDIYNGIVFENMKISNSLCQNCEDLIICGGRCGRMHKDFDSERIKEYCDMNKFMFKLIKRNLPEILKHIESCDNLKKIFSDPMMDYTELLP